MNDDRIPNERDLPPGRLESRREHLLAEANRRPTGPRLSPRLVAYASAGACAAVVGVALAVVFGGESTASASPYLVSSILRPDEQPTAVPCELPVLPFGCEGAVTVPEGPDLDGPPRVSGTTEIIGGTDKQQSRLRSIIEAMRPTAIREIEVSDHEDGVLLRMRALDNSGRTVWQELLVAGAFRDRSEASGEGVDVFLADGPLPPGDSRGFAGRDEADLVQERFESAAELGGFELDELTVFRPAGVAVAATISTDDPANFLVNKLPPFLALIGDLWTDYDGVNLRLVDDDDNVIWEVWSVARTAAGSVGSRQDIAGCSPIAHHGPTPPPCPVVAKEPKVDATPLTVDRIRTPEFDVRGYLTSGTYPQVSGSGAELVDVNAALRQAVLDDQEAYAVPATQQLTEMPWLLDDYDGDGVYSTSGGEASAKKNERISASSVVVSYLMPSKRRSPGGTEGAGWISATVDVQTGKNVELSDLFASPARGGAELAEMAKTLASRNACVERGLTDPYAGESYGKEFLPSSGNYRHFALTPEGLQLGFEQSEVANPICGRIRILVPYAAVRSLLGPEGQHLVAGVRAPAS